MRTINRWAIVMGALLLAAAVGFAAFQVGTAHGVAMSGQGAHAPAGAVPYPPYYAWHGPWGFGLLFLPLLFFAFWFLIVRGLFWHRAWHGGWRRGCCGPYGPHGPYGHHGHYGPCGPHGPHDGCREGREPAGDETDTEGAEEP